LSHATEKIAEGITYERRTGGFTLLVDALFTTRNAALIEGAFNMGQGVLPTVIRISLSDSAFETLCMVHQRHTGQPCVTVILEEWTTE
jgi:hypothetical protein